MSQETIMEMKSIEQQLQQLMEQGEIIKNQSNELNTARNALESIDKNMEKADSLVQVASGVFAKATINNFSKYLVNVGAGVVIEKSSDEVIEQLKKQQNNLMQIKMELELQEKRLIEKAKILQQKILKKNV